MIQIVMMCSVVYVAGGYHMVPDSLPYLRDLVDFFMLWLAITSSMLATIASIQVAKKWLTDFLLRNR